jgi:DNA-binding CsgD family transcriptional regulator
VSDVNPIQQRQWSLSFTRSVTPAAPSVLLPTGVSKRQIECLDWAQRGKSSPDIAAILGISGRTVDAHLYKLCLSLGVKTRLQAVLRARELGLLRSPIF